MSRHVPLDEVSEEELVARAKTGDWRAFELLAQRHAAPLYRVLFRMLGNHADAEDVRQETFLRAFQRLSSFRGEAAFRTWLFAIAVKRCLSHRRARRPEAFSDDGLGNQASLAVDPETQLCAREEQARVQRVLVTLAPPDRLLIILKHIEGLRHDEIAKVLGCSVESSRSRLTRARKIFCERFQREVANDALCTNFRNALG